MVILSKKNMPIHEELFPPYNLLIVFTFQVFGALIIAKLLCVPIVMSYHTHVPMWVEYSLKLMQPTSLFVIIDSDFKIHIVAWVNESMLAIYR